MAVALRLVDARETPAHAEWLRQVYPFYLHDLSEFEAREYRLSAPGPWELSVLERNAPALAFWRALLPEAAAGLVREETLEGLVRFSFDSAAT